MELFFSLSLFIISIQCIQSEKPLNTYIVKRLNPIRRNLLSAYTVYDLNGIKPLYRLKPVSTDIDTIVVSRHSQNETLADMEGEWIENIFDVTFSIYDNTLNKSIDGLIRRDPDENVDSYTIICGATVLHTKVKFWSGAIQVLPLRQKKVLAEIRKRSSGFGPNVQFELKIYSNQYPIIIYFFLVAIDDHRKQMSKIKWTQPKKSLRTYVIKRDNPIKRNILSTYTVYNSADIVSLYRLKPKSTDIDTIIVIRQRQKDMVANMEGEWAEKFSNVTFSLYDKTLNKWTNGIIRKNPYRDVDHYLVSWNGRRLSTKTESFNGDMKLLDIGTLEVVAQTGKRTGWFSGNNKFDLKIYSDRYPDMIYFLLIAINDHRYQIFTTTE